MLKCEDKGTWEMTIIGPAFGVYRKRYANKGRAKHDSPHKFCHRRICRELDADPRLGSENLVRTWIISAYYRHKIGSYIGCPAKQKEGAFLGDGLWQRLFGIIYFRG